MRKRRRSYHSSYPTYRSRVARREHNGCFSSAKRFLMNLLTGMFFLLFAILFVCFLLALLMHLHQVEEMGVHVLSLITIYGPSALLLTVIITGVFLVLGIIYGMVKVLAAISETLSYASLAHTKVKLERAKIHRHRQVRPLPKLRSPVGRHTVEW